MTKIGDGRYNKRGEVWPAMLGILVLYSVALQAIPLGR